MKLERTTMELNYQGDKETLGLSGNYTRDEWRGTYSPSNDNAGMDDKIFRQLAAANIDRKGRDRVILYVLPEWFVQKDGDLTEDDTVLFGNEVRTTDKAYNVDTKDGRNVWFPKSISKRHEAVGDITAADHEDDGHEDQLDAQADEAEENLVVLDGVGPATARNLGKIGFTTVADVADAGNFDLQSADGVGTKSAKQIRNHARQLVAEDDEDAVELAEEMDVDVKNAKDLIDAGLTTPEEVAETDKPLSKILANAQSASIIRNAAKDAVADEDTDADSGNADVRETDTPTGKEHVVHTNGTERAVTSYPKAGSETCNRCQNGGDVREVDEREVNQWVNSASAYTSIEYACAACGATGSKNQKTGSRVGCVAPPGDAETAADLFADEDAGADGDDESADDSAAFGDEQPEPPAPEDDLAGHVEQQLANEAARGAYNVQIDRPKQVRAQLKTLFDNDAPVRDLWISGNTGTPAEDTMFPLEVRVVDVREYVAEVAVLPSDHTSQDDAPRLMISFMCGDHAEVRLPPDEGGDVLGRVGYAELLTGDPEPDY